MTESPQSAPKPNGLQTVLNTIAAPKEAFETLRVAPTWGWAAIIAIALNMIGLFLMVPAMHHGSDAGWAANVAASPQLSQMSPEKLASAKAITDTILGFVPFFAFIYLGIGALISTLIMLVFNAIGRGSGTFKSYWATTWNIFVPTAGIGVIITAVIVMLRGAESFGSSAEVQQAMPSLAMVLPHAGKVTNFLAAFTPFTIWNAFLVFLAMIVVGRTARGAAWGTAIVSIVVPALFALLGPGAK